MDLSEAKKHIIMVLGTGINERGWAGVVSHHGRVTLLQLGLVEHVEIWEAGKRVYNGPETKIGRRYRWFDDLLLGTMTFFRTLGFILNARRKGPVDMVLAGYYSSAFAAVLAEKLRLVSKTASFLADFLPPHGTWLIRTHRRITGWLTAYSAKCTDEAWALSPRIHTAHANPNHFVVPIKVNHFPTKPEGRVSIGYIGYPSPDHGLEILFDIARRHGFPLDIVGDSPYLNKIRHLAPPGTVFYGVINDEARIGTILSRCFCSYAIYRDVSPNSYSYYGFPSKTLYSFASNVPIVITNVAHFNENFGLRGVGRVVSPEAMAIESAILDIKENYRQYSAEIDRFRDEWNQHVEQFHSERLKAIFNK